MSTLEALARGARGDEPATRDVLAVLDARRGEAFAARVRRRRRGAARRGGARPEALAGARRGPAGSPSATARCATAGELEAGGIEVPPDDDPRHRVGGGPLVRLAAAATAVPVATLVPDYVRLPDAEIHHRRVAAGP